MTTKTRQRERLAQIMNYNKIPKIRSSRHRCLGTMRCLPYCAIRFTCTSLNLYISVNLRPVPLTSYGGIFERGSREYTLDDFYSLALDKMDRYVCLKKSDVIIPEGDDESSSSEEDDGGGDSSDDDEDEDED